MAVEVKSSKVVNVQADGTWENSYGMFYAFEVEMENGDLGRYSSKKQDQTNFVKGQEAYYSLSQSQHGNRIKPEQNPNQSSSGGGSNQSKGSNNSNDYWAQKHLLDVKRLQFDFDKQKLIIAQSSYAQAVQIYQGGGISVEELTDQANVIFDYVMSKSEL